MKLLVLGAGGMLGNAVMKYFSNFDEYAVYGTVRNSSLALLFPLNIQKNIISGIDVENFDSLGKVLNTIRPNLVINCIGLVKQLSDANDPLTAIPINSIFPHRLALLTSFIDAKLVHMSTDCIFSGLKGAYKEDDFPDACDLYGRSKFLGEVDYPNTITLRTSIIGHELNGSRSLVDWFLSQSDSVRGYGKAIFSGLPTVEIAKIIKDFIIPNTALHGVYHVSADPINKYELLKLVAIKYGKSIQIDLDNSIVIDRSLNSDKFRAETGFKPASWDELIDAMHNFNKGY
jgi:dTDP-4-dehydrorhamnose reductase